MSHGEWEGGKGCNPRKKSVSLSVYDLRYELIWAAPERKEEILKLLEELENEEE